MRVNKEIEKLMTHLDERFDAVDAKLTTLSKSRQKSMEWIGQLSEHIRSLDEFREEVRASFEPIIGKLDGLDEVMRILRHATSDVSRRIQQIEQDNRELERAS